MAEVKTAPVSKPVSKAAAKTTKPKPTVQAKPELTASLDRLVQPFLNTARPGNAPLSGQKNTAALSGLWKNSVQTKLKVGQPGDKYEQEADAVADKVVSSPKPDISKQPEEDKLNQKPMLQFSTEPEEEVQTSLEEEPELQKQADEEPEIQAQPAEEDEIQASTEPDGIQAMGGDGAVSPDFESKLSTAKSGGSPLPQSTISQVEPHVNADLSGVRVHTDSNAAQLNQSLGAQAFANQNHIFFNEGKYNPGTTAGDHLIAHEATHTVQQGASLKKKPVEEEAPDELQMATDEAANETKQAATAPPSAAPPADASPNANTATGGSDSGSGTNGIQNTGQAPANDNGSAQTNNVSANPPANSGSGDALAQQPQEDLQKENPITQRAASYKEEEVAEVKALGMEGNSEQAMASFTGAGASQVAMAFPTMGDTLNQKLGAEKQTAATEAPKLTAGTTGVKDQKSKKANEPGGGKSADLKDGITEAEPGQQQLEPHQEGAPLPTYKEDKRLDEGKPAKEESGGFFSWLFDKFKNLMGGINTQDKGLNTQAGAAPKLDTKGKANPQRAENQSKEGKDQVNKEKQEAANEINNNPGQQNVQPLFFEEPKEVVIDATLQSTATTSEDQSMADFVHLPLPESVRTQTDLDLAPRMEKTLAKPRQETKAAAQKRDTEKQAAINDKQAEVEKMNKDAEKEQQNLVNENRQAIAAEQKRGVDEAETQMNAFSTEADKEKGRANKDVNERIKNDQAEGEKKLKAAEGEAATKKKEGEDQAKAEKEAAKKNSKDKSWWGKFKDAVSSAVSWVTEKIGKIFDAIRKAVKFIIDKAKKAALALIEAGRKWIIDKLDKFGSWLKEKANKYLKHFPALRKRVNAFIDKTVDGAKKLVNKVADGLKKGVEALADALGKAINSVLSAFEGVLTAAVQFAGAMLKGDFAEALKIAFMATCKVAGIDPNPILNFINKAGETIGLIFKNPAAFFGNVAGGVKLGIDQFVKNIKKHLISGLISWLTGAMSDVPIQLPEKFDLKGIFSLVMQILGLTYDRIRAKVVKRIGPKGEQVVSGMEKTFQFVKDLITKGPIALWERIKDKFNEIKEMAMEKIRNLVTIEVVKAGIKWLIGLLNPASAIVKAVLMLYDFVMFLIERKDQIVGFVTAIFDTVGPLARGQIKKAGNAVEGAMGRGVPVILGLLANLAGLGGIGKSVSKVIKTIQKPVDKVVDPVINWLVDKGKKLGKKVKGAVSGGPKGIAIGAMKKAGASLQKVPKSADKAEQTAQADLARELKLANKGLPKKAGKVTGNITNKGKIIEDSKATFKLSAGDETKVFVRKYASQTEASAHSKLIKKVLTELDSTETGEDFKAILNNKKKTARKLESEKKKELKKGVSLKVEIKNEKTVEKDEFIHWKADIKPNASENERKDEVEVPETTLIINKGEPGAILQSPSYTGKSGAHTAKNSDSPKIGYVANVPTLFSENAIGQIHNRYEKDGFESIDDAKQRFALVIGLNDSQSLDQGEFSDQQSTMSGRANGYTSTNFPVAVHSFFWQPYWSEVDSKDTKKVVPKRHKLSYDQAKIKYEELKQDQGQGPAQLAAFKIAEDENDRRGRRNNIPFGRVRDEIKNSSATSDYLALFRSPAFEQKYVHWGDADAQSLRAKTGGGAGASDEQTRALFAKDSQEVGQALFNRYDSIINSYSDDQKPLLIFGGVEFRIKLRENNIDPAQYARVLAQELDNQVRKALVGRHPNAVYPNDQNLLINATGSKVAFNISSGSGRNEALNLRKGLLAKAEQSRVLKIHGDLSSRIVNNHDAIIATDDQAYKVGIKTSSPDQSIISPEQIHVDTRWFKGAFRGMTVYDIKQLFLQRQSHANFSDPRNWANIFGNNLGLVYQPTFKEIIRVAQWLYPSPSELPDDLRGLFDVSSAHQKADTPAIDNAFITKIMRLPNLAKPISYENVLHELVSVYQLGNLTQIQANPREFHFGTNKTKEEKSVSWFIQREPQIKNLISMGIEQRRTVLDLLRTGVSSPTNQP